MARTTLGVKMDDVTWARVDAAVGKGFSSRIRNRSQFMEAAALAYLAHDEGVGVDLARVVRRFMLRDRDWADDVLLGMEAERVLARFDALQLGVRP